VFIPLVSAREILNANDCVVEADEVVEGTLLVFCENVFIHGQVNGDLIGAALRTDIEGTIMGNIYLISGQLDVRGTIAGDLHFAGPVLRLNPPGKNENGELVDPVSRQVARGVKAITLSSTLFEHTSIHDGFMDFGYQLIIAGDVQDEVNFWGSLLAIGGKVGDNVYAIVGDSDSESSQLETLLLPLNFDLQLQNPGLIVMENGEITGDLYYTGLHQGLIRGEVLGKIEYTEAPVVVPTLNEPGNFALYFEQFGREFTTLLVIGLLAMLSMNKLLYSPLNTMRTRPFPSIAVGMLAFLLSFPIVLIILLLSLSILGFFLLIGLSGVVVALSLVLGLVNLGGVSVFYFVAIFLARALVALGIGRVVLRLRFNSTAIDEPPMRYLALLVGVFLLALIVSLPVIGSIFNALALFWGLGAILNIVITEFNHVRDTTPTATPAWYTPSPAVMRPRPSILPPQMNSVITPPPVEEQVLAPTPGTENLPDGFDWSFFKEP
jgi:hypothetical protein